MLQRVIGVLVECGSLFLLQGRIHHTCVVTRSEYTFLSVVSERNFEHQGNEEEALKLLESQGLKQR